MQNSPARAAIDVGSVIAGTYTIEALIGRGGMGAVFLASHARLPGKKVAIKVLHAEMTGDEVLARFKREAQIASMLSHPNIVHIEDYNVTEDGMPYLVLEYLQGESLAQRLQRGPLAVEQAFSIIRQIGSALAAAHQRGIVHRDLKPQNVFLVPSEIEGRAIEIAKILDFGISKMRDSQTVKTQDSALLGTPQYMAPEQATGQHASVDERTDVFALGAIVYEMLAGQPAFSGASIPEVVFKVVYEQPTQLTQQVPLLSAQIATAVHRAMSKPADERFSTVSEFVEALTGHALAAPRTAHSVPPADVGVAAPSRLRDQRSAGNDAFAQTVGSGDHGEAVRPPPTAPPISTSSGQPLSELAPTISAATAARRSRASLFIGGGIVLAAVGALVTYLAMRGDSDAHQVENQPVAVEQPAPSPAPPPPPPLVPEPARPLPLQGSASPDVKGQTATPTAKPPVKKAPKPSTNVGDEMPAPPATGTGDSSIKQTLDDADAALKASEWKRAEELANAVINSQDAFPKQKMRALMIHGMVECLGNNSDERARIDLRRITAAPQFRFRLLKTCQKAGFLQTDR